MTVGRYINSLFRVVNKIKVMQSIQYVFPGTRASDEITKEIKQAIDTVVYYEVLLFEMKAKAK